MTELDIILEDIRTNPADDLPRLALGDWLMEQDDPAAQARGEFIHARCRAAALPPRDPERAALQRRALDLRDRHEHVWIGGLADHLETWDFERGMILAGVSSQSLRQTSLRRLMAHPGWKWVIGLRGLALSARELRSLFTSASLAGITSLDLRDCEVSRATALALATSRSAHRLTSLDLGFTHLSTEGFQALVGSPTLESLRILNVCNNSIGYGGARALATSPTLPLLENLDLSRNSIDDRGATALAGSPYRAALRILRLGSCGIRDRGGMALAISTYLAKLDLLDLSDNPLHGPTRDELREHFRRRVLLG